MAKKDKGISASARKNAILSILSMTNAKVTSQITEEINQKLGTEFSRKTVERDLDDLTAISNVVTTPGHPQGYKLSSDFPSHFQPSLTKLNMQILFSALSKLKSHSPKELHGLILELENNLFRSIPQSQRKALEDLKPLQVATASISGRPKGIATDLLILVFKALRDRTTIQCEYTSPYTKNKKSELRLFAPLLMQFSGGAIYLVVQDLKDESSQSFKRIQLARVRNAKDTKEIFRAPNPKDYEKWMEDHYGMGGGNNKIEKVELICGKYLGQYLLETEIHPSQNIEILENNTFRVKFNLALSPTFVRALAGFAWDLESISPKHLKTDLIKSIESSSAKLKEISKR